MTLKTDIILGKITPHHHPKVRLKSLPDSGKFGMAGTV